MKRIYSTLLLLCCVISTMAQYVTKTDIPYTPQSANAYSAERCKLDVYYPTELKDAPVLVWFHGGGLEGGNKYIPNEMLESGMVIVSVNYRLLPKCSIDECIDDAAAAVAWTFHHAEEFNGSTQKIFLSGHSAGGYLIDMIGLEKKWLAKYDIDADKVAALIPFSGQIVTHYNVRREQGLTPMQITVDQYAPLTHIRPDAPPMVIISADRELELYGRYEEQAYFWRMLKLVGHQDVTLYEMQGFNHGNMPEPAFHILKETVKRLTK